MHKIQLKNPSLLLCGRTVPVVILGIFLFIGSGNSLANGFMDIAIAAGHEDNVSRGFLDRDITSSTFHRTQFTGGKLFQPFINTSISLSATGSYQGFVDQHGFNAMGISTSINAQHKFGMGAYTPRILFNFSAAHENSRGAERDRNLYTINVGYFQRLTAGLSINLGMLDQTSRGTDEPRVDFDQLPYRSTRPTDPMDYSNSIVYGGMDYVFENNWQVSFSYQYYDGYIVSSAKPPVQLFRYAQAVALDPAFNDLHLMYLMESKADMWSSGLSVPLTSNTAIDLSYSWQIFEAENVGDYDNAQFSISLVHQF